MFLPKIIQGGMGVNISNWHLARAVAMLGQLGTFSGVALERVMARILQIGGLDANEIVRVLSNSPDQEIQEMGKKIIAKYWKNPKQGIPVFSVNPSRQLIELTICANYTFTFLAKEGHCNPVSVNYLEKIAMPHLFAIYGAMRAGVDFITMGAGIPDQIPAVINAYLEGKTAIYKIPVIGGDDYVVSFDPEVFFKKKTLLTKKPGFIPIIASNVLAIVLNKRLAGEIHGFVIEEPTAGGHNAPPRNKVDYGVKDVVDYKKIGELGLPFWIGGSYASPEKLQWAISVGATGIQAGSIFALSNDSGMDTTIRQRILKDGFNKTLKTRTDRLISPTGFPFKVVELEGTIAQSTVYEDRKRVCDQGALVSLFKRPDGSIGYRCASEPVEIFLKKGGKIEDTFGRGCVCNGLITTAGLRHSYEDHEQAIVTLGDNTDFLSHLLQIENGSYSAKDAINYLLGGN